MHIQVTYTLGDFYQASLLHWQRKPFARLLPLLGAIVLLAATAEVFSPAGFLRRDGLLLAGGLYLLLYPSVILRLFAVLSFRQQRALRQELLLAFDDREVRVNGETLQGRTTWEQYQQAVWNAQVLLLYPTPEVFQILPRRAFANDEDWHSTLKLIQSKVSNSRGPDPTTT